MNNALKIKKAKEAKAEARREFITEFMCWIILLPLAGMTFALFMAIATIILL